MAQQEADARRLQFGEVFSDESAVPLMISEVQLLLEKRKADSLEQGGSFGDEDAENALEKTLEYVTRFSQFRSKENVSEVRQLLANPENQLGLVPFEICALANLCPDEPEEAKTLIPSLERVEDAQLRDELASLQAFRSYRD